MLRTRYPPLAPSMGPKYPASGLISSTMDWTVGRRIPSLANSFPFSVGKRNVGMKRVCTPPSRPKENSGGLPLLYPPY